MANDVSSRILTAATLAEQAAADLKLPPDTSELVWERLMLSEVRQQFLDDGYEPEDARVLAASGPSHWGAVAELLRTMVRLHAPMKSPRENCCSECYVGFVPCASLAALLPLADQIIRDLVVIDA